MLPNFFRFLGLMLLMQCQETTGGGFRGDGTPSTAQPENNLGENVVPPTNISGAFLACAQEVIPSADNKSGMLGCRLNDKSNNRIPANPGTLDYSISVPNVQDLTLVEGDTPDVRYDQRFYFAGTSDPTTLQEAIKNSRVSLRYVDANGDLINIAEQRKESPADMLTPAELNLPRPDYENQARSVANNIPPPN